MKYLFLLLLISSVAIHASENWVLKEGCPPSFELRDGQCFLVNRYQFYDSLQNRGVGGTQTGLPEFRDGFSPQQIDLGRYLFFDPLLSKDGSLSCASCHQPELGFADGRPRSIGMDGQVVKRAAPSLWNVGFLKKLFWDARASTLEEQAVGPLFAADEMANTPQKLMADLVANPLYPELFKQAYPGQATPLSLENVLHALAAFQTSLVSLNSPYDRYALGHHAALSDEEIAGMNVYRSFVARCSECHTPPLFTNQQIAVIGTPEPEGVPLDIGAEETFHAAKLKGGFKVPTLRNIVKTAPYMHSGRFDSLRDAVEFYTKGRGHAVPAGVEMQIHWHIWEPKLTDQEIDDIVTFLGALTDESLIPETPDKVPSGLSPLTGFQPTLNQQQAEHTDE
ncbi:cytochrome-c peroxidase [Bowmanella yangjiangensis]|uniref:C-type cytochrome n=1 Tax=Bowmanella yangjiangensis TaxID=2811230 RepID=A0ABS3CN07_9ALTE|nr:cytochrome c peroxidase [Bowmanella yangjiangensis]MBN7818465.1 c-type cytochrome [Bowmanella yangjiangensis]